MGMVLSRKHSGKHPIPGALGGIDQTTLPLLRPFRFGGAAVLGALWGNHPSVDKEDSIITQYKKLQAWN